MIKEWRKGCSCARNTPTSCHECTNALIDAMEDKLIKQDAIKALMDKFEVSMSKIQQGGYGLATFPFSITCAAGYASQLKALCSSTPKNKKVEIRLEGGGAIQPDDVKSIIQQINKSLDTFNYPECLDRIVDVAVDRAEKEILRFKELDRVEAEHDKVMGRMNIPGDFRFNCSGAIISGGGGTGGISGWWNN